MPEPRLQVLLDSVAGNVRRLRQRKALTQEALAEAAGFDSRFLQRVERGEVNMRLETLARLATALGVPPGGLLKAAALPAARPGRPRRVVARVRARK